jgi:hypothetical protein
MTKHQAMMINEAATPVLFVDTEEQINKQWW